MSKSTKNKIKIDKQYIEVASKILSGIVVREDYFPEFRQQAVHDAFAYTNLFFEMLKNAPSIAGNAQLEQNEE